MAKYTDKNNLLDAPVLEPTRSYESDGTILHTAGITEPEEQQKENPLIETLDALDNLEVIADILPPAVRQIVKDLVRVLSLDTQGKIIKEIEEQIETEREADAKKPGPSIAQQPEYEFFISPADTPDVTVNPKIDLFSKDPGIEISVKPADSLYSLATRSYIQDDSDIKKEYASRMTDIIQKFYIRMVTIADDANLPEYAYLMMDFDGNAVQVLNPNLKHLKDSIIRNQILKQQLERQYKKTHSTEQALVLQRAWLASARAREKYMQENYINR